MRFDGKQRANLEKNAESHQMITRLHGLSNTLFLNNTRNVFKYRFNSTIAKVKPVQVIKPLEYVLPVLVTPEIVFPKEIASISVTDPK